MAWEKAALSLAAAAVSPIITKLANVAAPYFGGDITEKELRHLQTVILPKILTVIDAAEKIDAPKLRPWLMELQAAAYEAEDVLDMYEYNKIENEVSPFPASFKKIKGKAKELFAPLLLKTEMRKSLEKLQESANEADKLIDLLGLANATTKVDSPTMISQRPPTSSKLLSPVFGRDKERDDLVSMLTAVPHESSSNGRNITIHAIHSGIGGAGKTTLAQYVFNDARVGDHFDSKIWIHVSRAFDITRIIGEIIQSIEKSHSPPVGNLDALHRRLEEVLKSKRFLLVLDDVWIEDRYLCDQLLIPLIEGGEAGSRILITTRQEVTAQNLRVKDENIIHLTELKTKECWSILKYYAFGDADKEIEDSQLASVGEEIVCKLKNSPLAARLVGCLLGKKVSIDAWRRILDTDMLGDTLNVILLSFKHLPPQLQRCFAICSLHEKGFEYDSNTLDQLIQLWIAQGYIEATGNESLEDKGKQYFDDLVSYSLFQRNEYLMHDLVHDVAEKVSKDYCFRIEGDVPVSIPATVIHLSVVRARLGLHLPNILKLTNLHTFDIFSVSDLKFNYELKFIDVIEHTAEMFKKLTKLRVLRFRKGSVPELNSSVGKLKHLRNLQLKGVKKLPESLFTLYHLQFLDLEEGSIDSVPDNLKNLRQLRRLSLPYDAYSKIKEIGGLISLQELRVYDAIQYGGLHQLGNLQQLRGRLEIKGLENVKGKAEAIAAKLNEKRHLEELKLIWGMDRDGDAEDTLLRKNEDVLEGLLDPNPTLQQFKIEGYKCAKSPNWLGNLNNLISLELENCPNIVGILNNVDHLPGCLKNLSIHNCPHPMQLPERAISSSNEELQTETSSRFQPSSSLQVLEITGPCGIEEKTLNGFLKLRFSSLSSLILSDLPSVTSLCLDPHLTSLKDLWIDGLKNLSSIQDMRSVKSLETLRIYKCPMLRRIGGGGENITDCRFSSIERYLEIDEPLMLPVLLHQQGLNSLTYLRIRDYSQDVAFTVEQEDVFPHLTSLRFLTFWFCYNIPSLPGTLDTLSSLETVCIYDCRKLESLPNLPSSLESLWIEGCDKVESLPNLPSSLKLLCMFYCPHLKEKYEEGGPLRPQIHHIPSISIA